MVDGSVKSAVKVVFAGEPERPEYGSPTPDVIESERSQDFQLLSLGPLVRMCMTSFRLEDRVLLRDMLDNDVIDDSWLARLPNDVSARLKELIDTPGG